jgi:hypothetical protein
MGPFELVNETFVSFFLPVKPVSLRFVATGALDLAPDERRTEA